MEQTHNLKVPRAVQMVQIIGAKAKLPRTQDFMDIFTKQWCPLCLELFDGNNWERKKLDHLVQHFPKDFPNKPCPCVLLNYKSAEYYHVWGYAHHVSQFNLDLFIALHEELGDAWCMIEHNADKRKTQNDVYKWILEQVKTEKIAYNLVAWKQLKSDSYYPNHPRLRNHVCQLCKPEHRDHFFENDQFINNSDFNLFTFLNILSK